MKSGKKLLLVLLCLVIASLLFAGGASEVENGDNLSAYELKDPRPTLKMLMSPSTYDYNERPEAAEIEELTGYKVEYYKLPSENSEQALALAVASGNDYDVIQFSSPSSFSSLMSSGALLPLNDYINNICPEFFEVMPAEFWSGVSDSNGNIYGLPYMHPRKTNILSNFVGVCIFSIILAVVARQFILPEDIKPDPDPADAGKKRTMFSPTPFIITLGIIAFGCMSCEGTMYDWSVVYFKEIIGADNDTSRFGYIAYMSAMACGRFLGDAFITRYGVMKVLQCSGVLVFIGMIAAVVYPDVLISSLGFLLVGAGVSTVVPICYSMAGKSRRMSSGMAIATVSTIGFFGFLMGPPLIGFIAHASSLRWSLATMACIGMLVTILAPRIKSRI